MKIDDKKRSEKGRKKRFGRRYTDSLGSVVTLAGAGGLAGHILGDNPILADMREAGYHARHNIKVNIDAVKGGPEGMRAAKNLQEAIEIVDAAREGNEAAARAAEEFMGAQRDFTNQLVQVYKENETVARNAERIKITAEGFLKNLYEVGNDLKPKFMDAVDNKIMKLYGVDPVEAREKSKRVKDFYKEVREYFDSREVNEHTVKEFCNLMEDVQKNYAERNVELEEQFPNLISHVREGYEVEDILFNTGTQGNFFRKDVEKQELTKVQETVDGYVTRVDETEGAIIRAAPEIQPYNTTNFVDYAFSPVTWGIAAGLVVAGLKSALPGFVKRPINKVLGLPFSEALYQSGRGVAYLGRKGYHLGTETLKNIRRPEIIEEEND